MPPSHEPLVTPSPAPLAPLVRALRDMGELGPRAAEVDALLDGLTLPLDALLPHLPFRRGGYCRTLVWRDDRFELLLITWPPRGATPIHGHAGQHCWLVPLAGELDLDDYALLEGGQAPGPARLMPLRSRRIKPGELDHRDAHEEVHAVTLASSLGVSLHVYARPLDEVLVYDLAQARCALRRLRYDAMVPLLGA